MTTPFIAYGDTHFLLSSNSAVLRFTQAVLVSGSEQTPSLLVVDPKTGEIRSTEILQTSVIGAQRALGVPSKQPSTLQSYNLPGLDIEQEWRLEHEITLVAEHQDRCAVALSNDTIALLEGDVVAHVAIPGAKVLQLSADGLRLAVGTESGKVLVCDAKTGALLSTLTGARSPISALAWSDDGALLAASSKASALVWPSSGGKASNVFKAKHWAIVIGFYGHHLLVYSGRDIVALVEVKTKKILWEQPLYGAAILRGKRVIAAHFEHIREIDVETGEILRSIAGPHIHLCNLEVDGDTLFVTTSQGARLLVGDLATGEWRPSPLGHESHLHCAQFIGDRLLTGEHSSTAILWRRGESTPLAIFRPPSKERGYTKAVCLDGDAVFVGMGWQLYCFQAFDSKYLRGYTADSDITMIVAVGELLLVCTEAHRSRRGEIILLDKSTLSLLHNEKTHTTYTSASVTGSQVRLMSQYGWNLYDVGARQFVVATTSGLDLSDKRLLSPDEKLLIVLGSTREAPGQPWESSLLCTNLASGGEQFRVTKLPTIWASAFDPSGARFATLHFDLQARVWSTTDGALLEVMPLPTMGEAVYWHPDGASLFVSCRNGVLREYRL